MTELQAFTCDGCGDTFVSKGFSDTLGSNGWYQVFGPKAVSFHACKADCLLTLAHLLVTSEEMSGKESVSLPTV